MEGKNIFFSCLFFSFLFSCPLLSSCTNKSSSFELSSSLILPTIDDNQGTNEPTFGKKRGPFSGLFNDPIFPDQWHLQVSERFGLHLEGAWMSGISGSGVTIGVCIQAVDVTNRDLASRYLHGSLPINHDDLSDLVVQTGTAYSSLMVARSNNRFCSIGVAPLARLFLIEGWDDSPNELFLRILMGQSEKVQIFWFSHGMNNNGVPLSSQTKSSLRESFLSGRHGKGIFAIGSCSDDPIIQSCNQDALNALPEVALVNEVTRSGFSSRRICSKYLVAAPTNVRSTYGQDCSDYECTGNRASSALVAGVVALLLEKNHELRWSDIHQVLASTSTHDFAADWQTNGAGYSVSHFFGFGVINVTKAFDYLNRYRATSEPVQQLSAQIPSFPIESCRGTTSFSTVEVETSADFPIFYVQVSVDVDHQTPGDLEFKLTSPAGTEAILITRRGNVLRRHAPRLTIGDAFSIDLWSINSDNDGQQRTFQRVRFSQAQNCCQPHRCKVGFFEKTAVFLKPDENCDLSTQLDIIEQKSYENPNEVLIVLAIIIYPDHEKDDEISDLYQYFPVMGVGSFFAEMVLTNLAKNFRLSSDLVLSFDGSFPFKSEDIPQMTNWEMGSNFFLGEDTKGTWILSVRDTFCEDSGTLKSGEITFSMFPEMRLLETPIVSGVHYSDPLYPSQWHLHSDEPFGLNLEGKGFGWNGKNVHIGVLTYAADERNRDLNLDNTTSHLGTKQSFNNYRSLGTGVASLAAGVANNHFCSVGVANEAKVVFVEVESLGGIVSPGDVDLSSESLSSLLLDSIHDVDVYLLTFGLSQPFTGYLHALPDGFRPNFTTTVKHGRRSKGTVIVGNILNNRNEGGNCNHEGLNAIHETLNVAQVTRDGKIGTSPICASYIVAAPAELYTTIDQGCSETILSGSQGSSAVVAGVVALLIQKQPTMTNFGIMNVLLATADVIEQSGGGSWQRNGVGRLVSHDFGYGLVNPTRALEFLDYNSELKSTYHKTVTDPPAGANIPDCREPLDLEYEAYTEYPELALQTIELIMMIQHPKPGELEITLTSPSGTKAVLMTPRASTFTKSARITVNEEFYIDTQYSHLQNEHMSLGGVVFARVSSSCCSQCSVRDLFQYPKVAVVIEPPTSCRLESQIAKIISSFSGSHRNQLKMIVYPRVTHHKEHQHLQAGRVPVVALNSEIHRITLDNLIASKEQFDLKMSPSANVPVKQPETEEGHFQWSMSSTFFWGESLEGTWVVSIADILCEDEGSYWWSQLKFSVAAALETVPSPSPTPAPLLTPSPFFSPTPSPSLPPSPSPSHVLSPTPTPTPTPTPFPSPTPTPTPSPTPTPFKSPSPIPSPTPYPMPTPTPTPSKSPSPTPTPTPYPMPTPTPTPFKSPSPTPTPTPTPTLTPTPTPTLTPTPTPTLTPTPTPTPVKVPSPSPSPSFVGPPCQYGPNCRTCDACCFDFPLDECPKCMTDKCSEDNKNLGVIIVVVVLVQSILLYLGYKYGWPIIQKRFGAKEKTGESQELSDDIEEGPLGGKKLHIEMEPYDEMKGGERSKEKEKSEEGEESAEEEGRGSRREFDDDVGEFDDDNDSNDIDAEIEAFKYHCEKLTNQSPRLLALFCVAQTAVFALVFYIVFDVFL